jgi:hypothetical protein
VFRGKFLSQLEEAFRRGQLTCQRLGVEPWAYLHDVLIRLPTTTAGQFGDLLPDHWQAARQARVAAPLATETATPSAESASGP